MGLEDLRTLKCVPCEGGVPKLTPTEAEGFLRQVQGWTLDGDCPSESPRSAEASAGVPRGAARIRKAMAFKDFVAAMAFLNEVARVAEEEGHHPDFSLHSWNKVDFTISTHAIHGLSRNDFILAAKIDALAGHRSG